MRTKYFFFNCSISLNKNERCKVTSNDANNDARSYIKKNILPEIIFKKRHEMFTAAAAINEAVISSPLKKAAYLQFIFRLPWLPSVGHSWWCITSLISFALFQLLITRAWRTLEKMRSSLDFQFEIDFNDFNTTVLAN